MGASARSVWARLKCRPTRCDRSPQVSWTVCRPSFNQGRQGAFPLRHLSSLLPSTEGVEAVVEEVEAAAGVKAEAGVEAAAIGAAQALEFSPPVEVPGRVIRISSFRLPPVAFPRAQAGELVSWLLSELGPSRACTPGLHRGAFAHFGASAPPGLVGLIIIPRGCGSREIAARPPASSAGTCMYPRSAMQRLPASPSARPRSTADLVHSAVLPQTLEADKLAVCISPSQIRRSSSYRWLRPGLSCIG
jgi:hypothetical protein